VAAVGLGGLTACGSAGDPGGTSATGVISVVAAENTWGSLAAQLGGDKVEVASIIDSPDADPHDYEPTAADGRHVAAADLVIINGIGYDTWATKLVAATGGSGPKVLTVGDVVGLHEGDNPHQWYSPVSVSRVLDRITAEYAAIDPADASYFEQRRHDLETGPLHGYNAELTAIRGTYAGTPVGASESIFTPMASYLGLDLLTPSRFLTAISEGTDPSAGDKTTIDRQIVTKAIKVYVYNSQNATPDVQAQVSAARKQGIPVVTITETLTPAGASFEQWQTRQLTELAAALKQATGR